MATANGILGQSPHFDVASTSLRLSTKRKRAESNEPHEHINGFTDPKVAKPSSIESQKLVEDFIVVLKRYVNER
jgi:hypothetical protein